MVADIVFLFPDRAHASPQDGHKPCGLRGSARPYVVASNHAAAPACSDDRTCAPNDELGATYKGWDDDGDFPTYDHCYCDYHNAPCRFCETHSECHICDRADYTEDGALIGRYGDIFICESCGREPTLPMSLAPRDGTVIVGIFPDGREVLVFWEGEPVGCWEDHETRAWIRISPIGWRVPEQIIAPRSEGAVR